LLRTEELLGYNLMSFHNVHFMLELMREIRESIDEDTFQKLKEEWIG
jgi:tRNA-guanine family transglycosylase